MKSTPTPSFKKKSLALAVSAIALLGAGQAAPVVPDTTHTPQNQQQRPIVSESTSTRQQDNNFILQNPKQSNSELKADQRSHRERARKQAKLEIQALKKKGDSDHLQKPEAPFEPKPESEQKERASTSKINLQKLASDWEETFSNLVPDWIKDRTGSETAVDTDLHVSTQQTDQTVRAQEQAEPSTSEEAATPFGPEPEPTHKKDEKPSTSSLETKTADRKGTSEPTTTRTVKTDGPTPTILTRIDSYDRGPALTGIYSDDHGPAFHKEQQYVAAHQLGPKPEPTHKKDEKPSTSSLETKTADRKGTSEPTTTRTVKTDGPTPTILTRIDSYDRGPALTGIYSDDHGPAFHKEQQYVAAHQLGPKPEPTHKKDEKPSTSSLETKTADRKGTSEPTTTRTVKTDGPTPTILTRIDSYDRGPALTGIYSDDHGPAFHKEQQYVAAHQLGPKPEPTHKKDEKPSTSSLETKTADRKGTSEPTTTRTVKTVVPTPTILTRIDSYDRGPALTGIYSDDHGPAFHKEQQYVAAHQLGPKPEPTHKKDEKPSTSSLETKTADRKGTSEPTTTRTVKTDGPTPTILTRIDSYDRGPALTGIYSDDHGPAFHKEQQYVAAHQLGPKPEPTHKKDEKPSTSSLETKTADRKGTSEPTTTRTVKTDGPTPTILTRIDSYDRGPALTGIYSDDHGPAFHKEQQYVAAHQLGPKPEPTHKKDEKPSTSSLETKTADRKGTSEPTTTRTVKTVVPTPTILTRIDSYDRGPALTGIYSDDHGPAFHKEQQYVAAHQLGPKPEPTHKKDEKPSTSSLETKTADRKGTSEPTTTRTAKTDGPTPTILTRIDSYDRGPALTGIYSDDHGPAFHKEQQYVAAHQLGPKPEPTHKKDEKPSTSSLETKTADRKGTSEPTTTRTVKTDGPTPTILTRIDSYDRGPALTGIYSDDHGPAFHKEQQYVAAHQLGPKPEPTHKKDEKPSTSSLETKTADRKGTSEPTTTRTVKTDGPTPTILTRIDSYDRGPALTGIYSDDHGPAFHKEQQYVAAHQLGPKPEPTHKKDEKPSTSSLETKTADRKGTSEPTTTRTVKTDGPTPTILTRIDSYDRGPALTGIYSDDHGPAFHKEQQYVAAHQLGPKPEPTHKKDEKPSTSSLETKTADRKGTSEPTTTRTVKTDGPTPTILTRIDSYDRGPALTGIYSDDHGPAFHKEQQYVAAHQLGPKPEPTHKKDEKPSTSSLETKTADRKGTSEPTTTRTVKTDGPTPTILTRIDSYDRGPALTGIYSDDHGPAFHKEQQYVAAHQLGPKPEPTHKKDEKPSTSSLETKTADRKGTSEPTTTRTVKTVVPTPTILTRIDSYDRGPALTGIYSDDHGPAFHKEQQYVAAHQLGPKPEPTHKKDEKPSTSSLETKTADRKGTSEPTTTRTVKTVVPTPTILTRIDSYDRGPALTGIYSDDHGPAFHKEQQYVAAHQLGPEPEPTHKKDEKPSTSSLETKTADRKGTSEPTTTRTVKTDGPTPTILTRIDSYDRGPALTGIYSDDHGPAFHKEQQYVAAHQLGPKPEPTHKKDEKPSTSSLETKTADRKGTSEPTTTRTVKTVVPTPTILTRIDSYDRGPALTGIYSDDHGPAFHKEQQYVAAHQLGPKPEPTHKKDEKPSTSSLETKTADRKGTSEPTTTRTAKTDGPTPTILTRIDSYDRGPALTGIYSDDHGPAFHKEQQYVAAHQLGPKPEPTHKKDEKPSTSSLETKTADRKGTSEPTTTRTAKTDGPTPTILTRIDSYDRGPALTGIYSDDHGPAFHKEQQYVAAHQLGPKPEPTHKKDEKPSTSSLETKTADRKGTSEPTTTRTVKTDGPTPTILTRIDSYDRGPALTGIYSDDHGPAFHKEQQYVAAHQLGPKPEPTHKKDEKPSTSSLETKTADRKGTSEPTTTRTVKTDGPTPTILTRIDSYDRGPALTGIYSDDHGPAFHKEQQYVAAHQLGPKPEPTHKKDEKPSTSSLETKTADRKGTSEPTTTRTVKTDGPTPTILTRIDSYDRGPALTGIYSDDHGPAFHKEQQYVAAHQLGPKPEPTHKKDEKPSTSSLETKTADRKGTSEPTTTRTAKTDGPTPTILTRIDSYDRGPALTGIYSDDHGPAFHKEQQYVAAHQLGPKPEPTHKKDEKPSTSSLETKTADRKGTSEPTTTRTVKTDGPTPTILTRIDSYDRGPALTGIYSDDHGPAFHKEQQYVAAHQLGPKPEPTHKKDEKPSTSSLETKTADRKGTSEPTTTRTAKTDGPTPTILTRIDSYDRGPALTGIYSDDHGPAFHKEQQYVAAHQLGPKPEPTHKKDEKPSTSSLETKTADRKGTSEPTTTRTVKTDGPTPTILTRIDSYDRGPALTGIYSDDHGPAFHKEQQYVAAHQLGPKPEPTHKKDEKPSTSSLETKTADRKGTSEPTTTRTVKTDGPTPTILTRIDSYDRGPALTGIYSDDHGPAFHKEQQYVAAHQLGPKPEPTHKKDEKPSTSSLETKTADRKGTSEPTTTRTVKTDGPTPTILTRIDSYDRGPALTGIYSDDHGPAFHKEQQYVAAHQLGPKPEPTHKKDEKPSTSSLETKTADRKGTSEPTTTRTAKTDGPTPTILTRIDSYDRGPALTGIYSDDHGPAFHKEQQYVAAHQLGPKPEPTHKKDEKPSTSSLETKTADRKGTSEPTTTRTVKTDGPTPTILTRIDSYDRGPALTGIYSDDHGPAFHKEQQYVAAHQLGPKPEPTHKKDEKPSTSSLETKTADRKGTSEPTTTRTVKTDGPTPTNTTGIDNKEQQQQNQQQRPTVSESTSTRQQDNNFLLLSPKQSDSELKANQRSHRERARKQAKLEIQALKKKEIAKNKEHPPEMLSEPLPEPAPVNKSTARNVTSIQTSTLNTIVTGGMASMNNHAMAITSAIAGPHRIMSGAVSLNDISANEMSASTSAFGGKVHVQQGGVYTYGQIYGLKSNHGQTDDINGFNANGYGLEVGLFKQVESDWSFGMMMGMQKLNTGFDGSQDKQKASNFRFGPFVSFNKDQLHLNALLTYGWTDFDNTRHDLTSKSVLSSRAKSRELTAYGSIGYDIPLDKVSTGLVLTPNAELLYLSSKLGGYTEEGNNGLKVEKQSRSDMVARAGMQARYSLLDYQHPQEFRAGLGYQYNFLDDKPLQVSTAGQSSLQALKTGSLGKNAAYYSAGYSVMLADDKSLSFDYMGATGKKSQSHALSVTFEMKF